jgi:hypothetical protein
MDNARIAAALGEAAELLEEPHRRAAFRRAARTVENARSPMRELYDRRGPSGLEALPGIGRGIAGAIAEMLVSGRWRYLERLRRYERTFTYTDAAGVEHDCVVLEPRRRLHGREAIRALLGIR